MWGEGKSSVLHKDWLRQAGICESPTTSGSLLGYGALTVKYQMLLIHSSLNFYWFHHLLPTAVPPAVWYNLPAVSASCSSPVSTLTDKGVVCFNLFAESSPPCCSRLVFLNYLSLPQQSPFLQAEQSLSLVIQHTETAQYIWLLLMVKPFFSAPSLVL